MRVLIVEDDEKLAAVLKKGLEEEQYAVDVSRDGLDGAHWAIENIYDLIILDIMLPKKDGVRICREVRNAGIHTPILMLTARDMMDDKVKGLDAGLGLTIVKKILDIHHGRVVVKSAVGSGSVFFIYLPKINLF